MDIKAACPCSFCHFEAVGGRAACRPLGRGAVPIRTALCEDGETSQSFGVKVIPTHRPGGWGGTEALSI